MSRQDANAAFARTSFLYGGNAAYIEDLYANYESRPRRGRCRMAGVLPEPEGRAAPTSSRARAAPPGRSPNWPLRPDGDLVAALDGQWAETEKRLGEKISAKAQAKGVEISSTDVQQATRDSIHALMLIRAYRMRGHFHAKLDPLGARAPNRTRRSSIRAPTASPKPTWTAAFSSTRCSGSNSRRCARSSPSCAAPIARRSAWSSCTSPTPRRRAGSRSASKAATRKSASPAKASAPSSTSWWKRKASRNSSTSNTPAPSASASTAASR